MADGPEGLFHRREDAQWAGIVVPGEGEVLEGVGGVAGADVVLADEVVGEGVEGIDLEGFLELVGSEQ